MKQIFNIGCAALLLAGLTPPLFAKDHKGPAPASSIAIQSRTAARNAQIQQSRAAQVQRSRLANERNEPAVTNRDFMNSRRPTVAFGGSDRRGRDFESRELRRDFRFRTPPVETLSGWDRDRIYTWNSHRWHWRNDAWVVIDDSPAIVGEYTAPVYSESSGTIAADVQSRLAAQGYNPGPVDGVIGAQTRGAISDFQADHALPVTGQIDTPLLRTLGL